MSKMTEADLLRVLNAEQDSAYHAKSGQISKDREQSLRDYTRMPYGTEQAGRSSVVASDVFDAVEGMIPDLIDVFVASDKAVVFEPVGPEDEESAEQVTNACNHVFYKQNNGFLILYTAIKDGLMMKTGGVKWYWDERRLPKFDTWTRLTEVQIASYLVSNPDAEILEKTPYELTEEEQQQLQGQEIPPLWTIRVKTVKNKGKVTICPIPADEIHVSRRHTSILLDDCPYVAHVAQRSVSDIRQMGYKVTVDDVKAARDESSTQDRELRDLIADGQDGEYDDFTEDETQIRGWLREEYVLVDFDGDGISERRKICRLGDKILENVEFSHVPIACWTPYILQHQFNGVSVADLVSDFQKIRTEIWRAQLDNLDLANNQETVVLTDSQGNPLANIDDLLNRRPGGILREQAPNAIRPYMQRWQGVEALPMLEALEVAKENRTGYTRYSQGMDGDGLNKTATGVTKIMNASQKRMRLMARIVAEALVAPMFRGVFKTLQDYCMEQLSFRLNGKFVGYDPQNWRDGYDMTINVGIGTGDQLQMQQNLMTIGQAQFMLMQSPYGPQLVDAANVYELQSAMAENAGFKNPGRFFSDPRQKPPPQPQPSPEMIKVQADAQKSQFEAQQDAMKFQATQALEKERMTMQAQLDQQREEMQARQKTLEQQFNAQLEQQRIEAAERQTAAKLAFDKWKAEFDAALQIALADKSAEAGKEQAQASGGGDKIGQVLEALNAFMEEASAPLEILRNPQTGMAEAIKKGKRVQQIVRGPDGRPIGVQ